MGRKGVGSLFRYKGVGSLWARRAWADAAGLSRRGGRRSAGQRATARVWLCGVPPDGVMTDLRRAVAA